ncbi:hypothetical protein OIE69_34070 [Actinacidiphila glaucinigra]|nr:hypothetical protein [Actinacidiphila glaucinigra]WSD63556.1 hypothetical protein OIE69_34070 [Actinacidiphila glaucinigra]
MSAAVVDEVHAAAGGTDHRALDVLDDVDEVLQIPRLTNQAVQVVEDHSVDDAGCQITEEFSEVRRVTTQSIVPLARTTLRFLDAEVSISF